MRLGALIALAATAVTAATAVLVAAAVVLVALPDRTAASVKGSEGLTVTGTGTVLVVPDVAEWSFGVQTEGTTADQALAANSAAIRRVIASIKASGITSKDMRTEQVSLYPRTSPEGTEVVGYTATNSVTVTVRRLEDAGDILDAAVKAGANQIWGPTLSRSDEEELYEQALEKAYDKAKAKAERLAAKAGLTLGGVSAIVESGSDDGPVFASGGDGARAEAGIEPGTTKIQAKVSVSFETL